jgi:hypothetical protein
MKYGATQGIKVNFATNATNATNATKLTTARAFTVDLSSTDSASFDGTVDVEPGISGTLSLDHGGTGSTTGLLKAYNNAIIIKNQNTLALASIRTANGAFYATSTDGSPRFGTLPID